MESEGKQDAHYSDSCEELPSLKERKLVLRTVGAYGLRVEFPGSKSRGSQKNLQPTSTHGWPLIANLRGSSRKALSPNAWLSVWEAFKTDTQGPQTRGFPVGGVLRRGPGLF